MNENEIKRAKELIAICGNSYDTATELAEAIIEAMDLFDELDDECSPIWDLSADYIKNRNETE